MYITPWGTLLLFLVMTLVTWLAMLWNKTKTEDTLAEYHLDKAEQEHH